MANLITRGTAREDGTYPAPLFHLNLGWELYEQLLTDLAQDLHDQPEPEPDDEPEPAEPDEAPAERAPTDTPNEPSLEDTLDALADTYPNPERRSRPPTPWLIDPNRPEQRCELADGTPIHPNLVRSWLPFADLRRLVLSADSEILDLGRRVRSFPTHLKQALLAAARGRCQIAGCDAPISWLQADHIQPWRHHGPTATHNGQILCANHNRTKRDTVNPNDQAPP